MFSALQFPTVVFQVLYFDVAIGTTLRGRVAQRKRSGDFFHLWVSIKAP